MLKAERNTSKCMSDPEGSHERDDLDMSHSGIWNAFAVWETRIKLPGATSAPAAADGWDPFEVWQTRVKR